MIKKVIVSTVFILTFISCKPHENEESSNNVPQSKDSSIVGVDKDENGCLASAGYTWSKLNKECIRVFTGIQLLPINKSENTDDAVMAAYVLFNENRDKAEIFLPEETSIILTKNGNSKSWLFEDYQLIAQKGYVLRKNGKDLFAGDGEIGNKVSGSDEQETE